MTNTCPTFLGQIRCQNTNRFNWFFYWYRLNFGGKSEQDTTLVWKSIIGPAKNIEFILFSWIKLCEYSSQKHNTKYKSGYSNFPWGVVFESVFISAKIISFYYTESQHVFKSVLHFQPSFTINNFSKILVNSDGYLWGLVLQFLTASRKCGN